MAVRHQNGGSFPGMKTENQEEEVIAITPPDQKPDYGYLRSADRSAIKAQISKSPMESITAATAGASAGTTIAQDPNAKAGSATYIPTILHEYYRQASAIFKIDYICALCSKPLKCRSARDMRDHALSHGGVHWASAFRCLLCPYHSHSRRSVAKHVTTAHLIPDGVQCTPGELMENEIFSRQDELLALVRDCFPLSPQTQPATRITNMANSTGDFSATNDQLHNGMNESDMALPVEMSGTAVVGSASNGFLAGLLQRYGGGGDTKMTAPDTFGISEENENADDNCDYDAATEAAVAWLTGSDAQNGEGSSADDANVTEGWTVVEDGADTDVPLEYSDEMQKAEMRQSGHPYPRYQATFSNVNLSSPKSASGTPMLEGLLRDFQFQPNSYGIQRHSAPSVQRTTRTYASAAPLPPPEPDDPRALIERLLNVVAPDVARFLLEEAIRARATAANNRPSTGSVPMIESVSGSVSIVGPLRQIGAPTMVPRPVFNPPAVTPQRAPGALAAVVSRLKQDRLGKIGAFKCPECQGIFKRRRYLERHVRARHRLHCYRCTMHGCEFSNARELWYVRRHHAKHHANDARLVCRFCKKQFPNSDEMTSRHHGCCSMFPKKTVPPGSSDGTPTQAVNGSSVRGV